MLQVRGKLEVAPSQWRVTSEVTLVNPETARLWRATKHFDRQRILSPENIERLSYEMRKGRFIPGTQVYICAIPDGEEVIVNGNHTLEAICHCGIAQLLTATTHPVADVDEAGLLYAVFDSHKRRTLMDSMRAAGVSHNSAMVRNFGAAVTCIIAGFRQGAQGAVIPHADVIRKMDDYSDAIADFEEIASLCTKECASLLKRAPILAICLETLRYQPVWAREFWSAIARDSGLCEGMPEHTLLRYLRNNATSQNRTYWARATALAWNAKFKNAQILQLNVEGLKKFTILGTPHENGVVKWAT
jgi:hypothetical protein